MGQRRPWVLVVWCVGLVAGTALFHGLGAGVLVSPPLEPAAWGGWVTEQGPEVATVAVLRLVVLGLCWYLVGVTTIGVVVRLLRAAALIRVVDALTVPWVRRLLQQGLGAALATAMVASAAGAAPASQVGPAAGVAVATPDPLRPSAAVEEAAGTDRQLHGGGAAEPGEVGAAGEGLDALPLPVPFSARQDATEVDVPPVLPPVGSAAREVEAQVQAEVEGEVAGAGEAQVHAEVAGAAEAHAEVAVADGAGHHVVRSGDSLWRIAEQRLAGALDRAPEDAEIVPYWRELIERNRAGLPDPDDPDLILPGQRLELPALPEA